MVAVFSYRVAVVVLVGHRNEPLRSNGVFQEEGKPVAAFDIVFFIHRIDFLILADIVPHVLQFQTNAVLFVNLVNHFAECEMSFNCLRSRMTFYGLHVVIQIDVHQGEVPVFADLLLDLEVEIAIEHLVSYGEERRGVTFGANKIYRRLAVCHYGVAFDVVHLAVVECELGAVFSAKSSLFRDGVVDLELYTHLAIRLCRIREHRRQAVSVGVVERRDETDVEVVLRRCSHRLETHIVHAFGLKHYAESLL